MLVFTISNYQVIKANPPQLMPYHKDTSDVICDDEVYITLVRDCKRRLQMFTKKEEEYETEPQKLQRTFSSTSICHRKWSSVISFHCVSSSKSYTSLCQCILHFILYFTVYFVYMYRCECDRVKRVDKFCHRC